MRPFCTAECAKHSNVPPPHIKAIACFIVTHRRVLSLPSFLSLHFLTSTLLPFPSFTMRRKRPLLFSLCIMQLRTYLLTQHIENCFTHFPILDPASFLHRKAASLIRFQATPPRSPRSPRSPPAPPASIHAFFSRMQTNSHTCLPSSSA